MPDSTRGILIKKTESLLLHLADSEDILNFIYAKYYPDYPDYYPVVAMCGAALGEVIASVRKLRDVM